MERQHELLLPVPYYMVTYTLPEELRAVARAHQRAVYGALFRASADALKELALDPKYLGAEIGMVGILQTWTRDMMFHPHIHYIVPGGGLSPNGSRWIPTRYKKFLVPVTALGRLFRGKFRDEMKKADLLDAIPPKVWKQDWVVHCEAVGSGRAAIKYLAPYVYRIAISNSRIVKLENEHITFQYKDSNTGKWRCQTLHVHVFIRRFLQHVLPRSFVKIRYFGFMAHKNRNKMQKIKRLFEIDAVSAPSENTPQKENPSPNTLLICPHCGSQLLHLGRIPRMMRAPPRSQVAGEIPVSKEKKYLSRALAGTAGAA
jgi:hypothetical protein